MEIALKSTTDVYECDGLTVISCYKVQEGDVVWTVLDEHSQPVDEERKKGAIKNIQKHLGVY